MHMYLLTVEYNLCTGDRPVDQARHGPPALRAGGPTHHEEVGGQAQQGSRCSTAAGGRLIHSHTCRLLLIW